MSAVCQITGKKLMFGNHVSHSNRKTRRTYRPNLFVKTFFIPEENRSVTLRVSGAGLRHISKNGITACLKEARKKGYYTEK
jgi:large subunit ribosomal protein L28